MIRTSPLRLKDLFFPQVSIKALVPKEPESAPRELAIESLDISFAFNLDADGNGASAGVKIASKETPPGLGEEIALYEVQIEAYANFEIIGPEHKDAMAIYLRRFAAAAALIGAAREQIAMTTARGPWGVVMFPIIAMDKVVGLPPKKPESTAATPQQTAPARKARAKRKASVV